MSFTSESGYLPITIDQMMSVVMENVNIQFSTSYTTETFLGTNFYKYFYSIMQRLQENEVKTSEIFLRMQEYFTITNESIQRPNTTHPGIYDYFLSNGYFVSTKPPEDSDAGKAFVCVNVPDNHARGKVTITSYANLVSGTDDTIQVGATVFTAQTGTDTPGAATFQASVSNSATAQNLASQINSHATAGALVFAWSISAIVYIRAIAPGTGGNSIALLYDDNDTNVGATVSGATLLGGHALAGGEIEYDIVKPAVCNLIKNCIVAGVVSQGTEIEELSLSNGQLFEFKFNLPRETPILLRLTYVLSENNQFSIASPDDIKQRIFDNVTAKYKLGKNFEPQRYYSIVDAPWAAELVLEWSDDAGMNYYPDVEDMDYDQVFTFDLTDITVVES